MSAPVSAPVSAVVFAAGKGTRMHSSTPKPLTLLNGQPLIAYVIKAIAALEPDRIVVVVGYGADQVSAAAQAAAPDPSRLLFAHQQQPRGTGDAMSVGLAQIPLASSQPDANQPAAQVLAAPADAPLVQASTLQALVAAQTEPSVPAPPATAPLTQPPATVSSAAVAPATVPPATVPPATPPALPAATLLTAHVADPTGYGRILRSQPATPSGNQVAAIVEHRDATDEQRRITEINSSIYCFAQDPLREALAEVINSPNANAQNEIQLTDTIAVLASRGHIVNAMLAPNAAEVLGVNNPDQLATCEAELAKRSRANASEAELTK